MDKAVSGVGMIKPNGAFINMEGAFIEWAGRSIVAPCIE
jgi:hypothetical protein